MAAAVNTATTGVKQSFTVPSGVNGLLRSATCFLDGGTAPTVSLQIVRSATTINLSGGVAPQTFTGNVELLPGDVVQWNVTAAGVGSTCDFTLSVDTLPIAGRVTLSFNGAAILDQGVTLQPGQVPLVILEDHVGDGFREPITAISSIAGTLIGGIEISEIDCSCNPATTMLR